MAQVGLTFDRIYRDNLWNGEESRSGPGSGTSATAHLARNLDVLVEALDIESVLDVGCGDGFWMPDLPGYVGFDASRVAVMLARKRHPHRTFVNRMPSQAFDLVILRDVIQHLPLADGCALLARIRATGSKLLLASTFAESDNVDVLPGEAFSPDMTAEPFSLGEPDWRFFDGYSYDGSAAVRDATKHLGLWRL